jgi:hypothetical protein
MDDADPEAESLQQEHQRLIEKIEELSRKRADFVREETRKRSQDRDDVQGSFSTDSFQHWDRDHARNHHLSEEDIEKRNDVLDQIGDSDRHREITEEIEEASGELDVLWKKVSEVLVNDDATKKDNIGRIWAVLGTDVDNRRVTNAVDCHGQYPSRLRFNPQTGKAEYKERVERRKENQVRVEEKKEILDRDGYECVRCGETEEGKLRIHHIVPVSQGGSGDEDNLATLCKACHDEAHGQSNTGTVVYGDKDGFQAWLRGASRGLETEQTHFSDY